MIIKKTLNWSIKGLALEGLSDALLGYLCQRDSPWTWLDQGCSRRHPPSWLILHSCLSLRKKYCNRVIVIKRLLFFFRSLEWIMWPTSKVVKRLLFFRSFQTKEWIMWPTSKVLSRVFINKYKWIDIKNDLKWNRTSPYLQTIYISVVNLRHSQGIFMINLKVASR